MACAAGMGAAGTGGMPAREVHTANALPLVCSSG